MDYEALKEQWSEVEDRDGVRLSWNVFPSSRMVSCAWQGVFLHLLTCAYAGSIALGRADWGQLHSSQREA